MAQGAKLRNLVLIFKKPKIRIWHLWLKCHKEQLLLLNYKLAKTSWILMKLSQKLLMYVPSHLTSSPGPSGISMSSLTPERDLEDIWSLDMIPDVQSCWNFHRHFWWMYPPIWHHNQVHKEYPYPPRIQEETWRKSVDIVADIRSW